MKSQNNSVSIVNGVEFPPGTKVVFFLFATTMSGVVLGHREHPTQWVPGAVYPGCEASHSAPYSANVTNA